MPQGAEVKAAAVKAAEVKAAETKLAKPKWRSQSTRAMRAVPAAATTMPHHRVRKSNSQNVFRPPHRCRKV